MTAKHGGVANSVASRQANRAIDRPGCHDASIHGKGDGRHEARQTAKDADNVSACDIENADHPGYATDGDDLKVGVNGNAIGTARRALKRAYEFRGLDVPHVDSAVVFGCHSKSIIWRYTE